MRIAIVGAGVSGLVCAHRLHRRHEIEVFEADARIGGHAHTVDVELDGEPHAVDTGFIVYNEQTYPAFTRLLAELRVETRPSDMSFSVSCERSGLEWASHGASAFFAQRRNLLRPAFWRLLREKLRFDREAPALLATPGEKATLGEWLCGRGYGQGFVDHYVVPMGAAIWSADPDEFLRFPAASFVRFFANHGLLALSPGVSWRVVHGGSRSYVEALAAPFRDRIRTGCAVRALRRTRRAVELATADGALRRFDRVILACHSDQALRLLADASGRERWLLGSVRYQRNEALLHTDSAAMPRLRRAWASWNYRVPRERRGHALVTYHMNRLQGLRTRTPVYVTLNGADLVDPARVLRRFDYEHPVFDAEALVAQRHYAALDGQDRTHFCGAWWGWGFHEDGVQSALAVCRRLGASA
jgi:predicted NAD/FAD-binding protein